MIETGEGSFVSDKYTHLKPPCTFDPSTLEIKIEGVIICYWLESHSTWINCVSYNGNWNLHMAVYNAIFLPERWRPSMGYEIADEINRQYEERTSYGKTSKPAAGE